MIGQNLEDGRNRGLQEPAGERYGSGEDTPLRANGRLIGISEAAVRSAFVQKVYSILGFQLVTTCILSSCVFQLGKSWVRTNPGLTMTMISISMVVTVGMMCVFACCPHTMRESPTNYIILAVFTIAKSVMVGFICIGYTQESVLIALGITALVVISLTLFAVCTKSDFTGMGPYLFVLVMVLMGFSIMLAIASWAGAGGSAAFSTLRLVYAAAGALIFSCYIVFDTQLIVGGKHHAYQFSVDDYAMAAINLYIDIIQLFLFLLQLFGRRR